MKTFYNHLQEMTGHQDSLLYIMAGLVLLNVLIFLTALLLDKFTTILNKDDESNL